MDMFERIQKFAPKYIFDKRPCTPAINGAIHNARFKLYDLLTPAAPRYPRTSGLVTCLKLAPTLQLEVTSDIL
jgi:hypothetical protein